MNIVITAEQAQAIKQYAESEGRCWKAALKQAWMTGNYPNHTKGDNRATLQHLRNRQGQDWLNRMTLRDLL